MGNVRDEVVGDRLGILTVDRLEEECPAGCERTVDLLEEVDPGPPREMLDQLDRADTADRVVRPRLQIGEDVGERYLDPARPARLDGVRRRVDALHVPAPLTEQGAELALTAAEIDPAGTAVVGRADGLAERDDEVLVAAETILDRSRSAAHALLECPVVAVRDLRPDGAPRGRRSGGCERTELHLQPLVVASRLPHDLLRFGEPSGEVAGDRRQVGGEPVVSSRRGPGRAEHERLETAPDRGG